MLLPLRLINIIIFSFEFTSIIIILLQIQRYESLLSSSSDSLSLLENINNSSIVIGSCSRPNIPPKARIRFVSTEKVKFAENETIYIICEENQFPHHVQKRKCRHGHWHGKQARCGKAVVTKINRLEASECSGSDQSLLSLNLTQSDETPYPLPPNSFHFTRVPENTVLSVFGSDCYRWNIQFEQPVEIQYLLIDINIQKNDLIKKERPKIDVNIKNRKCQLEHTSYQVIEQEEIFGNYFFCDLYENITKSNTTTNTMTKLMLDDNIIKTDNIELIVKTANSNLSVGLEAVFIGETYKKLLKHLGNKSNIECGRLEIERTGVLEQIEMGHVVISCNDSFITSSNNNNSRELFTCDANGLWQGKFPLCLPKTTCSKNEIIETLNPTIQLEQIGNVYWINDSEWLAIEKTWIHYTCANFEGIMVGKSERICVGGRWTNKVPHCTTALQSGSITISIIIVILIILITIFSLIVYLSIRAHGKKINKKLESAKYELEEKALNKQISASSDGYYSDIGLETIYEDCKEIYTMPDYEMADDNFLRYDIDPARRIQPQQLTSTSSGSSSSQQFPSSIIKQLPIEPEYLTMTEGTLNRPKTKPPQPPSTINYDVYEYSI
ncbi:uncharacterized protein LOC113797919 [Dermatophagoides pteronyssinus]|uniref:Uncharacterized protein LOC113797919 n=1 Tax=Dermatophagoides pteronyssinus TaxID=6956 RepID=A0A6P6YG18_DERPT|nr:uncharacterized protein LOC113797919 [Dermatophagoides pteronyssinus]